MPIKIMTPEDWRKANGGANSVTYIHFNMPPQQLQKWRDSAIKKSQAEKTKPTGEDTKDEGAKAR
jgi:hypothetical protein